MLGRLVISFIGITSMSLPHIVCFVFFALPLCTLHKFCTFFCFLTVKSTLTSWRNIHSNVLHMQELCINTSTSPFFTSKPHAHFIFMLLLRIIFVLFIRRTIKLARSGKKHICRRKKCDEFNTQTEKTRIKNSCCLLEKPTYQSPKYLYEWLNQFLLFRFVHGA